MRALFLTDGIDVPSSRFRAEQFFPELERRGIRCTLSYGYGRAFNRLVQTPLSVPYRLGCRLKRAVATTLARGFDVVFLQRTALPQTAFPERLLAVQGTPLVLDFDDAIYLAPSGEPSRWRMAAFRGAVGIAQHVLAGNAHLARVAAAPDRTTLLPTVVDSDIYRPGGAPSGEGVVLGWMGTSSNFPSLRLALPALRRLLEARPHTRLVIVSNARLPEAESLPRTTQVPWSRHREVEVLQSFDIGLMPLVDTPVTLGKCAFKMIQYMAVGRPVVASAVGANVDVFGESGAGRLVRPGDEFDDALRALVDDRALRVEAGARGRARVEASYSIRAVIDDLERVLVDVAAAGR